MNRQNMLLKHPPPIWKPPLLLEYALEALCINVNTWFSGEAGSFQRVSAHCVSHEESNKKQYFEGVKFPSVFLMYKYILFWCACQRLQVIVKTITIKPLLEGELVWTPNTWVIVSSMQKHKKYNVTDIVLHSWQTSSATTMLVWRD